MFYYILYTLNIKEAERSEAIAATKQFRIVNFSLIPNNPYELILPYGSTIVHG